MSLWGRDWHPYWWSSLVVEGLNPSPDFNHLSSEQDNTICSLLMNPPYPNTILHQIQICLQYKIQTVETQKHKKYEHRTQAVQTQRCNTIDHQAYPVSGFTPYPNFSYLTADVSSAHRTPQQQDFLANTNTNTNSDANQTLIQIQTLLYDNRCVLIPSHNATTWISL